MAAEAEEAAKAAEAESKYLQTGSRALSRETSGRTAGRRETPGLSHSRGNSAVLPLVARFVTRNAARQPARDLLGTEAAAARAPVPQDPNPREPRLAGPGGIRLAAASRSWRHSSRASLRRRQRRQQTGHDSKDGAKSGRPSRASEWQVRAAPEWAAGLGRCPRATAH